MTRIGDLTEESMTSFCKGCIVEAMTKAPKGRNVDKYEAAALQNFRNLLVCMGERTAQSVQRKASEEAIVTLADEDHKMLDEVYMQVMKQLTKNPSERSMHRGFQLLHRLCQRSAPEKELAEFVRAFLKAHANPPDPDDEDDDDAAPAWLATLAQACLQVLDSGAEPATHEEDDGKEIAEMHKEVERLTSQRNELQLEMTRLKDEKAKDEVDVSSLLAAVPDVSTVDGEKPKTGAIMAARAEAARQVVNKLAAQNEAKSACIKKLASDYFAQSVRIEQTAQEHLRLLAELKRLRAENTRLGMIAATAM